MIIGYSIVLVVFGAILGYVGYDTYLNHHQYRLVEKEDGMYYIEKYNIDEWRVVEHFENLEEAKKHYKNYKVKKVYR